MAGNTGDVLFDVSKKDDLTHEEIWDDTILIQQYDEALARVRKKLHNRLGTTESEQSEATSVPESLRDSNNSKKKKKKKNKKKHDWHIGDFCRARYSEDGQVYEGTIMSIHSESGKATVRYVGYNNEEDVSIRSLLKSKGQEARFRQEEIADDGQSELSDIGSSFMESDLQSDTDGERNSKRRQSPYVPSSQPHMMPPPSFNLLGGTHLKPPPYLPDLPPPPALSLDMSDDPRTSEALHTMLMSWYMTGYHTGYYQGLRQVELQKQRRKHK